MLCSEHAFVSLYMFSSVALFSFVFDFYRFVTLHFHSAQKRFFLYEIQINSCGKYFSYKDVAIRNTL